MKRVLRLYEVTLPYRPRDPRVPQKGTIYAYSNANARYKAAALAGQGMHGAWYARARLA